MLDQIGAVLVVMIVGNVQPHFMHLGRPAEQFTPDAVLEVPGLGHLIKGTQGLAFNPGCLLAVDVVAVHQRAQGALTHVFMVMTAQQVVEHAFAQCAITVVHALQFKGIEHRFKNRQPGREDGATVRLDAFKVDLVHFTQLEQFALEPGQAFGVDLAIAMPAGLEGQANGPDGARGADGFIPGQAVQGVLDAHDLKARRRVGLGVARRGDLAVTEVALGEADAAHLQAFAQQRFKALANDEFGTAAADISHQAFARRVGEGVGHTQVDQARFFTTGNHFNGVAQDFLGPHDKFVAVACFTQGVGTHDAHGTQWHTVDQLGEALEAIEPALHGFFGEFALFVDAGS